MKILLTTINMIFVLSLCLAAPAKACTLFAAAGAAVKGGGTLLAKNRDFVPSPQELRIVRSGKYAYLGLFSLGENGRWTLRAGVNEKASQTLASFIVKTTPDKKITILVKYRPLPENKGREEIQYFTNPF